MNTGAWSREHRMDQLWGNTEVKVYKWVLCRCYCWS